jgi:hypothetical protein
VQVRAAKHEIRARLADLRAIRHEPEILGLEMLPPTSRHLIHCSLEADVMAAQAKLMHLRCQDSCDAWRVLVAVVWFWIGGTCIVTPNRKGRQEAG